jgi:pescadillo protein
MLLPVEDYFMGATLPPHLSPFVEEGNDDYIPPERQRILEPDSGINYLLLKYSTICAM